MVLKVETLHDREYLNATPFVQTKTYATLLVKIQTIGTIWMAGATGKIHNFISGTPHARSGPNPTAAMSNEITQT